MEDQTTPPKRRRWGVPVLTVLVCALTAIAFLRIDVLGVYYIRSVGWNDEEAYEARFRHGWPTPFADHGQKGEFERSPTTLRDRIDTSQWTDCHMTSVTAAILDVALHLLLLAAVAVVVLRLEMRNWRRVQFSIADIFSLITTASMVLGLVYLDNRLCYASESLVEGVFVRMRDLSLFDRVMVLFAVACAVWLVVSTVIARLGTRGKSQG
jgi:hypothetical protein